MKVLVVDDDPFVLDFLKSFFENLKHDVTLVDNPADAMKKLVVEQPDLVLLDIMLPGKDGLVLLKEMKEIDKDVSIAMITAYKDAERVIEAFRLGAMDCLLKPFNVDYIKDTVLPRVRLRKR
jgi:CitB family two-component system response regulator MalR